MPRTLLVSLGLLSAVNLLGCSSSSGDGSPGTTGGCVDLSQLPTTPTISFVGDLMPIFGLSCIASSCHDTGAHKADLILGDPSACGKPSCYDPTAKWKYSFPSPPPDSLVTQVLTNLVNVASKTESAVMRVKPGDPANSFIMDKLLGQENSKTYSAPCQNQDTSKSTTPCGADMPLQSPSLCSDPEDAAKVQAIAQWIQQGAQKN